ncbi:MAG: hypothetical protein COA75_10330 [Cellvibrionales bacterium]|nr:MAG: hypothetical protein COA75_10330 [Cellvibrionales bacterium]
MVKLETRLEGLVEQLADPALYTDKPVQELNKLIKAQGERKHELQALGKSGWTCRMSLRQ